MRRSIKELEQKHLIMIQDIESAIAGMEMQGVKRAKIGDILTSAGWYLPDFYNAIRFLRNPELILRLESALKRVDCKTKAIGRRIEQIPEEEMLELRKKVDHKLVEMEGEEDAPKDSTREALNRVLDAMSGLNAAQRERVLAAAHMMYGTEYA